MWNQNTITDLRSRGKYLLYKQSIFKSIEIYQECLLELHIDSAQSIWSTVSHAQRILNNKERCLKKTSKNADIQILDA